MVEGNHWDQWIPDGFWVRQPLVTMVFDGCAPLVPRWNGYVPSLKSNGGSDGDDGDGGSNGDGTDLCEILVPNIR